MIFYENITIKSTVSSTLECRVNVRYITNAFLVKAFHLDFPWQRSSQENISNYSDNLSPHNKHAYRLKTHVICILIFGSPKIMTNRYTQKRIICCNKNSKYPDSINSFQNLSGWISKFMYAAHNAFARRNKFQTNVFQCTYLTDCDANDIRCQRR